MYRFIRDILCIIGLALILQLILLNNVYIVSYGKNSRAVANRYFEDRFEISIPGLPTEYDDVTINIEDARVSIKGNKILIDDLVPDQVYNNVKITFIDDIGRKYELDIDNVITSQPTKPDNKFVYDVYGNGLGRKPDHEGFKYWYNKLSSYSISAVDFVMEMITSSEFNSTYKNPLDKISALYRTIVGRAPDEDGLTFWMDQYSKLINTMDYSPKEAILDLTKKMVSEDEFKNIVSEAGFKY